MNSASASSSMSTETLNKKKSAMFSKFLDNAANFKPFEANTYDHHSASFFGFLDNNSEQIFSNSKITNFGDGHPTIYNKKMLFDTYPDKSRIKYLMSFNVENNHLQNIGSFFENFDYYGETRCDLHPRWSFDGSKMFIDSVHTGKRFLYKIEKNN